MKFLLNLIILIVSLISIISFGFSTSIPNEVLETLEDLPEFLKLMKVT